MYDNHQGAKVPHCMLGQSRVMLVRACVTAVAISTIAAVSVRADEMQSPSVIRRITGTSDKLELTTSSSRILTLDKKIPRVQVNNPDLLAVTPLSATQVQISAKKAGVTQVNLWDDEGKIHTVDILIYGDARELEVALQTQFPHASIKVFRYSESLVLSGFVDRPDLVTPIMQLAADYSPKVINNIQVGGVQQVLLRVKVMEVNRTKLRDLGVDWAFLNGDSILAASNVSGLIRASGSIISNGGGLIKTGSQIGSGGQTFQFGVFRGNGAFIGVLDALQQCQAAKILAQPDIVAVSGRPAQFQDGGEIPIPVPQSLGTTTIEFKPFGTIVDFLPIVLGNGNIRLEVRPQISAPDYSKAVNVNGTLVPALNTRRVDTAVEMKAGQTFALGGLIQELTTTQKTGLPYVSDLPIIGVPFRKTSDVVQETELLIMVTPEFVDPMDPCEAPCGGPGTYTTSPTTRGLYCGGHVEVPTASNPTQGLGACGQDSCGRCGCSNGGVCNSCTGPAPARNEMPMQSAAPSMATPQPIAPPPIEAPEESSTRVDVAPSPPAVITDHDEKPARSTDTAPPVPLDIALPMESEEVKQESKPNDTKPPEAKSADQPSTSVAPIPNAPLPTGPMPTPQPPLQKPAETSVPTPPPALVPKSGANYFRPLPPTSTGWMPANTSAMSTTNSASPAYTATRQFSPARQPVFLRNASSPNNPQPTRIEPQTQRRENNLIGPVGYDTQQ